MIREGIQPFASSVFAWGRKQPGANLISVSREDLVLTLLPRTTGRFTRSGLKVQGLRYQAQGYTERYLTGGEAVVAFNPEDVTRIWLLENGEYQVFELIESRFRGKDYMQVEALKSECDELIKSAAVGNQQARIDLARHIQSIAGKSIKSKDTKIKDIRKTRQREQRKRHIDFVKGERINE